MICWSQPGAARPFVSPVGPAHPRTGTRLDLQFAPLPVLWSLPLEYFQETPSLLLRVRDEEKRLYKVEAVSRFDAVNRTEMLLSMGHYLQIAPGGAILSDFDRSLIAQWDFSDVLHHTLSALPSYVSLAELSSTGRTLPHPKGILSVPAGSGPSVDDILTGFDVTDGVPPFQRRLREDHFWSILLKGPMSKFGGAFISPTSSAFTSFGGRIDDILEPILTPFSAVEEVRRLGRGRVP
eukprot:Polyplicarium_translucidae@DN2116_c0_g1_i1.p1